MYKPTNGRKAYEIFFHLSVSAAAHQVWSQGKVNRTAAGCSAEAGRRCDGGWGAREWGWEGRSTPMACSMEWPLIRRAPAGRRGQGGGRVRPSCPALLRSNRLGVTL